MIKPQSCLASWAEQTTLPRFSGLHLEQSLLAVIEAGVAKLMGASQWLFAVIANARKHASGELHKRVLDFFSGPVLEAHNLCFKFLYARSELRLFLLTGECNAADVKQLGVDLGYCCRKSADSRSSFDILMMSARVLALSMAA